MVSLAQHMSIEGNDNATRHSRAWRAPFRRLTRELPEIRQRPLLLDGFEQARRLRSVKPSTLSSKETQVLGPIAPYLVAVSAMLFAGISAVTLIYTVSHLDPPEVDVAHELPRHVVDVREPVGV
jgi:hypothetical protein